MPTLNLTLTAGSLLDQDFTDVAVLAGEKLLFVLYINGAGQVTKKSVNLDGGSADQIAISAGVKYTAKLKATDTLKLPAANVTYKTYKVDSNGNAVEHFSGTVTVNSASAPNVYLVGQVPSFSTKQKFDANAQFDVVVPAGARLTGFVIKNSTANAVTLNIGVSALGTTILNAYAVGANGFHVVKESELGVTGWSDQTTKIIYVSSGAWNSSSLEVWMIYEQFN
ncbi:MAG: hypothetical protein AMXMBFR48_15490 [Ignavibacteriales bacterium]